MPTTALIESCWRQYAVRAGKVTYLRSQSRSVGIMQINQHVWRGFYDVERAALGHRLQHPAPARRSCMRYVKDYAIPYAQKSGRPDDVPRAAYAVYNAGPRAVGRFAKSPPHPREARVDDKLLTLYRGIARRRRSDLANCGVATPRNTFSRSRAVTSRLVSRGVGARRCGRSGWRSERRASRVLICASSRSDLRKRGAPVRPPPPRSASRPGTGCGCGGSPPRAPRA